jgi:hypothetical protein
VTACSLIPPVYRWSASCDRIPITGKNFLAQIPERLNRPLEIGISI